VLLPEKASEEAAPITPPRFDAAYLNNPGPAYPNMSRRLREIGTVQLRVRVSVTGQPLEIQMAKSSGYGRLDESALVAVKKWKFQPAMRSGSAVEAWVLVPVEFSLTRS
jgi:protein TonB